MLTEENESAGTVAKNGPKTGQKKLSSAHPNYWKARIVRRSSVYKGVRREASEWSVKLQHAGKRVWFNLGETEARKAADRAHEIALCLNANGWPVTIARYKDQKPALAELGTLAAFLEAKKANTTLKPAMFLIYAQKLRQIAAWIARIPSPTDRFDRGEGTEQWRAAVGVVPMSVITTDNIRKWLSDYCKIRGENPVRRISAERSAASIIRQARCLFAGEDTNPFNGIKIKSARGDRYRSTLNPAELLRDGERDLPEEVFKAFALCLWAGLRKKEADLLEWPQVNLMLGTIDIKRTQWFSPKTDESQRSIDIPAPFVAYLAARKKKTGFVLAGLEPKQTLYARYRAQATWTKLDAWLYMKGVKERKKIHALRKESGSLIAQTYGIEAARAHLGHRDITTTSAYYVGKKARREVII